jgi:hypothetical protein
MKNEKGRKKEDKKKKENKMDIIRQMMMFEFDVLML